MSRRIIRKVSEREEVEADRFDENLYDTIDPDALNRIFEEAPAETRLEFPFRGYLVIVHGRGTIELDPR